MANIDHNNKEKHSQNKQSDISENTEKKKRESIAFDKFEVDLGSSNAKKKESKTPKKKKSPFKRVVEYLFPQKGDSKGDIARKILLLVAICVLIGTLAFLIKQLNSMDQAGKKSNELAENAGVPNSSIDYSEPDRLTHPTANIRTTAGTEEPEFIDLTPVVNTPLNVDFDYLRSKNPHTRGWIRITGTLVNHVILQNPDDDDFYIDHDFDGNYQEVSAEIISSWRNKWDGTDDNIILFGHNMASGYGFAYVNHYVPNDASSEPLAFYKVHPTIMLQRDGGPSETYKVFAGIVVNTQEEYGEVFNYTTKTQFTSEEDFNNYIIGIMDRSWFYTDVDLEYGDKLLTLSTCYWPLGRSKETRFAVIARKVRPGESEYVDTSVAKRNWGAKLWENWYDILGTRWYGSNWDTSKLKGYNG